MFLNERCQIVLKTIVDNPSITGKKIEKQLNLSRKQVSYTIKKINEYLKENGFMKIERLRTGKFDIPQFVVEEFRTKGYETEIKNYILSQKERIDLLLLILLSSTEELSTYHFTSALDISKNTLMSDLKKLKAVLTPYQITLDYNRTKGYFLTGKEHVKRQVLIDVVKREIDIENGKQLIMKHCGVDEHYLNEVMNLIEDTEERLNIRFTDRRIEELPFILSLIIKRINKGNVINELPDAFQHIKGTKECNAIGIIMNEYGVTDELEKMFLTAQIQISNIHQLNRSKNEIEKKLMMAIKDWLSEFEKIACIHFHDRKPLLQAIYQHAKPALYRIWYNYHMEMDIKGIFLPVHQYLHELVKRSAGSFEKLCGCTIPDEELIYFTVLIGAWLKREGQLNFIQSRKRAIVVCSNGVSVSNYLFITLKELFSNIEFVESLSVRRFYKYDQDFDIVFTTIRLETDKAQFLVKPFLDQRAKQNFREKVYRQLEGLNMHSIRVESLMKIIRMHSVIEDEQQLKLELRDYINSPPFSHDNAENKVDILLNDITLQELLYEDTLLFSEEAYPWKDAIEIASEPLLKMEAIEPRYVKKMIQIIEQEKPYIMIADGVIIAHADIHDGVNQVAMSLLKLPKRINICGYMQSDVIVILGTTDRQIHLSALNQLNGILENENLFNLLKSAKDKFDLLNIFTEKRS